ncbi:MAG TPA: hypothetical protein VK781_08810, partial [Solirubrobacteraceae bacterium]|nr:hypothetical protein [Solirubrobacteraceae bacterium]
RAVASHRDQPASRVGRRPLARPARGGACECLLRSLLGEVEVAEEADQRGKDTSPLIMKDALENR